MSSMPSNAGVLTISLDTELAWGCFDTLGVREHEGAYTNTREVIDELCDLFAKYDISATWALVAHLLEDCQKKPNAHKELTDPHFRWIDDWFGSLPCQTEIPKDLWYAPDILDTIKKCNPNQEVGLHGYSHMIFDEAVCPEAAAADELQRAAEVMANLDLNINSFVFPRNCIGHHHLLRKHNIEVYRGLNADWFEHKQLTPILQKGFRYLSEARMATPPVVTPTEKEGLVEVPGSQIFRPNHGGWQYTPSESQVKRAFKGLKQAAATGKIFHLWFHPFNLANESDYLFAALEEILMSANKLREDGQIEILTLSEIRREYRNGRW